MSEIQELNARFGLGSALTFEEGSGGLAAARISIAAATATIYLQGAHVAQWQPAEAAEPGLFLSAKSYFTAGKAIRGGVPLVFPWFADRKGGLPGPAHGFARTLPWEVATTEQRGADIALTFRLLPNQMTRDLGYDRFVLLYEVVVGAALSLTLDVENLGAAPLPFEEALHAYFAVSDIRQVAVAGLEGTQYLDRADNERPNRQGAEAIRFASETDQLHLNTQSTVTVADAGWRRAIALEKRGSSSTVVWNPWSAKAARLSDFGDEEWPNMVCVEPANAMSDAVALAPGGRHRMGMTVRLRPLP